MQDLTITIVQCEQHWEDKEANFEHLSKLLESKNFQTDLILLPEMFNTGFSMNKALAENANGASIKFLMSLAKKYSCLVGASLLFKNNALYTNRFVVVSDSEIIGHYDKKHLFSLAGEDKNFTAGTKRSIIQVKNWKINIQVCYDLRFPVFSRNIKYDPYDVLVYIANWPAKRQVAWDTLLKARAIENQCYTIGVNRVGMDGNQISYDGGSVFISAIGAVLERAKDNKEEVYTRTLSYSSLDGVRKMIPFLNDGDEFQIDC